MAPDKTMAAPKRGWNAVLIRPALSEDAEAIAAIYNAHIERGNCTMDLVPMALETVRQRMESLGPREALLVACRDQQVVGWGAVKKYSEREGYRVCCETSLFVDENHTGRGLGEDLLTALFECCRRFHYRHAVAKVLATNPGSVRFHQRHGYQLVGVQHEVGFVNGQWTDVAILERIFSEVAPPSSH